MARAGNGTYNLPAGQPVVTGTTISSSTHNTLMTNIGSVADAVNYGAFAVIFTDGATARIILANNAPVQTISLSGLILQSAQSSGGTASITGIVTRIA